MTARPSRWLRTTVLATTLAASAGCGGSSGHSNPVAMPVGTLAPEFSLPDVNPASSTFGTDVAPSQELGSASAWYFGHAT